MSTGYESVHVSPVHEPANASKAYPYAVTVKVDHIVYTMWFATHDEGRALREQPVESIVATCEQVAAARLAERAGRAERPSAVEVAATTYRERVELLRGLEVFAKFHTPSSSRRRAAYATGTLTEVGDDGIVVQWGPRSDRRVIPWARLDYVALSNPDSLGAF